MSSSKQRKTAAASTATALAEPELHSLQLDIDRNGLLEELQLLQPLAGNDKSTIPITHNVFIDASASGVVTLIGSNLETALETEVTTVAIESAGKTTVSASDLLKIIKSAPPGNIHFEMENDVLKIQFNGTQFQVPTLPADEYPALPTISRSAKRIELPTEMLKSAIAQVIFAVTDEDLRYAMNGALLRIDGNRMILVGTDGHRLSYVSPRAPNSLSKETIEVVVPRIGLEQLQKLLYKCKEDTIALAVEKNYGLITVESRTLLFRLIEAQFPNYEKFISLQNKHIAIFDRETLKACLEKVTTLAEPKLRHTTFHLTPTVATISWTNNQASKAQSTTDTRYEGPEISITFNGSYILEFLRAMKSKEVRLEVNTDTTAAVLKPGDDNPDEQKYVVMPVRI